MDTFQEKKSAGPWKAISIIFILLTLVAAAAAVFFFITMTADAKKLKDAEADKTTLNSQLNAFKQATGVQDASQIQGFAANINFKDFTDALTAASISNTTLTASSSSFIKPSTDGKYEIAAFDATGTATSGTIAYFYRALPSGDWTYSKFSAAEAPSCTTVSEDEQAAFTGIATCIPAQTTPTN